MPQTHFRRISKAVRNAFKSFSGDAFLIFAVVIHWSKCVKYKKMNTTNKKSKLDTRKRKKRKNNEMMRRKRKRNYRRKRCTTGSRSQYSDCFLVWKIADGSLKRSLKSTEASR